jgi:hypothetical protein
VKVRDTVAPAAGDVTTIGPSGAAVGVGDSAATGAEVPASADGSADGVAVSAGAACAAFVVAVSLPFPQAAAPVSAVASTAVSRSDRPMPRRTTLVLSSTSSPSFDSAQSKRITQSEHRHTDRVPPML